MITCTMLTDWTNRVCRSRKLSIFGVVIAKLKDDVVRGLSRVLIL